MKILVTIPQGDVFDSFFDKETKTLLSEVGEVEYNESDRRLTEDELCKKLKDKNVCITGWGDGPFTEKVISGSENLKVIAHTGGSVGGLTPDCVYDKGITVLSGNEIYADSVAEGIICYILSSLRRIPYYTEKMQREGWHEKNWHNEGLIGKTIGLVGFGSVSKYLLEYLKPFRCKVYVCSKHLSSEDAEKMGVEKKECAEIFSVCDVISLQLAQSSENYHKISYDYLSRIKKGALLVNTSRGSILDEDALVDTIEKNGYRAVLDVFEQEPLPMESKLRHNDKIMLIPHMGGPTMDRRVTVTRELILETEKVLKGNTSYLEISREKMHFMTK